MNELSIHWDVQPIYIKIYILFLVFVSCSTLVRWFILFRHLYRGPMQPGISLSEILDSTMDPITMARRAIGGRIMWRKIRNERRELNGILDSSRRVKLPGTLAIAETEFHQLWQQCNVPIQATKRMIIFIVLSISFIAVHDFIPTFERFFNNSNRRGSMFVIPTLDQTLWRLSLGLGVASFLYLGSMLFESALIRRRMRWEYLCLVMKNIAEAEDATKFAG